MGSTVANADDAPATTSTTVSLTTQSQAVHPQMLDWWD